MPLVSKAFGDIITFTRASTGTFFNSAGVLTSAAIDVPRFDYNPSTLAAQGLLIEEARTNLVLQSEDLATTWTIGPGVTVSTNATTAPSGTTTADKIQEDASTGSHLVSQNITFTAASYTASVFAKKAERDWIRVLFFDGTNTFSGFFNLTAGTIGTLTGTGTTATITAVGNDWYRCTITATTAAGSGSFAPRIALADGNSSYTGVTGNGLFLWGAQLEAGAFPTSYIPTTTTALTRSADVASVNTLSPWFNAAEGTLYGEVSSAAITVGGASRRIANINDGTEADRITVGWAGATSVGAAFVTDNSVTQAGFNSPSGAYPFPTKVALAYKTDDFQAAVNGSAFAADTSGTVPTVTQMTIGNVVTGGTGPQNLNGHVRRITYYPRRLSQAELTAITA